MIQNQYDVIILGGGPAGLTAGIYLARAKSNVLILDTGTPGGQMILTYEIANYPGFESISGYQLSSNMAKQAKSFGCIIKSNVKLSQINFGKDIHEIALENGEAFSAPALILATGGRPRMLNVPGETEFKGRGISYCATCDGDFFQDKEIVVVGGGNSALEEAVSLTKYASKVTILHEFDHFQAIEQAVKEAKEHPKIHFIMESHISGFFGDDSLRKVRYKNMKTGTENEITVDGAFIFIGYEANTGAFRENDVKLNQWNEIITDEKLQTSVPGVFAAGDCRTKQYRQITTAVADGTIAALNALNYIREKK